jgi:predicted Zn-dependent protease
MNQIFKSLKPVLLLLVFALCINSSCSTGKGFNLFSPEQDIELGRQVKEQILSNPQEYPVLPERGNEDVYRYVRGITAKILNSGQVAYRDEFAWEVYIIDDDDVLNAFASPGGYIFVYTGLIKFLDAEHELAGVLGHEIAHAAQRHSTEQMTKIYGISALVSIVTGNADPGLLEQIALSLLSLKFSRSNEQEADMRSVAYLCPTEYKADGAAAFFIKMEGQPSPPEFLSTHPSPANRVSDIQAQADELNCSGRSENESAYSRIKQSL